MKEFKDELLLSGTARRTLPPGSRSEPSLGDLADHLSAVADVLRRTAQNELGDGKQRSPASGPMPHALRLSTHEASLLGASHSGARLPREVYGDLARQAYATRRRRAVIFKNSELFGEPAWDILLDLYIAHVEGKQVSVSSACIGSAAPPTTGLRWLGVLSDQGLILREHDPEDQRRILVRLTEKGLSAMDEYFASAGPTA